MYLVSLTEDCDEDVVVREIMGRRGAALLSVVVDLAADLDTDRYSRLVRRIKCLCDAMIVARVSLDASRQQVEKAFSAGFHALILAADKLPAKLDNAVTQAAAQMFPSGAVFLSLEYPVAQEKLAQVVAAGLVPLCDAPWKVVQPLLAGQGLDDKWLYFLGFYRKGAGLGMKDKIVKKVLLETANLKHSLRVSQVEESYQSSSL
ncbi:hypothetical protein [Dethiobacter alkaliphilus]|uniref:Uncharacterized protein n=1 Tax=Dethiobacter alkaliphilus AHT 1 TaxID=555088 RepID=C0GFX3_DETAL|nr:hypothetical protein [Dethiobacter alkaliphilus]EEG77662.1 hypothetical protein DealDRAFT_1382 [Dethiobacter alkaliphilus AHT 1]MCW3491265.1 hypothetical protein [Dethiobacter alkaliphilus]